MTKLSEYVRSLLNTRFIPLYFSYQLWPLDILDLAMGPRMSFGFLIPDEHMQSVGKMYYEKLYPDHQMPAARYAEATYDDVASSIFMERAKELPWATPKMANVYSTRDGDIGRVVSLFDNFSHYLGQLGSPRRPGPKQLTREIIEQYQKVLEIDTLPRWYYLTDQA
ncbi:hypothetical protein LENED_011818 [Lentinula edodes]|uniref:Uncharacterized protein n=1 Tax=Lentinula edodes TaxID=5353 RepID=A0A1Q3ER21_LENED|nr:hypothetical protein LENED_011818 [Lentinula edodes]